MATILVVDDHAVNREYLATLLGYGGHRVLQAGDGREAIDQMRGEPPDLILADILMPTMDGFELVRRLRGEPAHAAIPVIFLTAHYLEREAAELARDCGVAQVINKPAEPETILAAVAAALGGSAAPAPPTGTDFDRAHLRLVTDKLAETAGGLGAVTLRLHALVEYCHRLAAERDPLRALDHLVTSARELVGARYALAHVPAGDVNGTSLHRSGLPPDPPSDAPPPPAGTLLGEVMAQRRSVRLAPIEATMAVVGLPANHPPPASLLAVPIASPTRVYGWLCLSDKLGAAAFGDEDVRFATALADQAGRIYENGRLYREVERRAAALEREMLERRAAERQVRDLNAELERRVLTRTEALAALNRELETFSYSVSHDLRAPLRAIDGFARILEEDHAAQLPADARHCVERIRAAVTRTAALIDALLQLALVTRADLVCRRVDVSGIATEIAAELRRSAPQRSVRFDIAADIRVSGDVTLLRTALENLLRNAWKYSAPRAEAHIEIGSAAGAGERHLWVRDNGVGFDMRYADKLFAPFVRLHQSDEFEGTGVGLATVQRIIHRHGGRVWVESAPDQGTTFHCILPELPVDG